MADDFDKQKTPELPPKLNLRRQGILKQAPAAAPHPVPKQETSRLVVQPAPAPVEKAAKSVPPKPDDKAAAVRLTPLRPKPVAATSTPNAPALGKPDAAAAKPASAQTDTKRKTSRIPLDKAKAVDTDSESKSASLKPKTIKIKPNAPLPRIRATQPLSVTGPLPEDFQERSSLDAEKHKTSRIPLEEALTADKNTSALAEDIDPARPKTIKIKRPGRELSAAKNSKAPAQTDKSGSPSLGETARLDTLPLDLADDAATQKRTIRVKRPSSVSGVESAPGRTPAATDRDLMPPEPLESESDEPGALWAILGLAATVVLCVVIHMLAAQAVGPNASGTELSSWKNGPSLPWPGKITK